MARLIIIEPRSSGCLLIDRARELGHDPVVLTADRGERTIPRERLAAASEVKIIDTNDDASVLDLLETLHDASPLGAVLPGFEHYVPVAARAAANLGLPGIDPDAAMKLHYKHLMRQAVTDAAVDQPAAVLVTEPNEVEAAVTKVGLPCVVKPVNQSGSLFVRRVDTLDEALAAIDRIRDPAATYLDRQTLPVALVEEYVRGPEFSIEGYVHDGVTHVLCITEKVLGAEPWFVEAGHVLPADLPTGVAAEVTAYVRRVVAALGLGLGPFHAEVRLADRGPLLMELAARLPGDHIPILLSLAQDIDMHAITLRAYLGEPIGALAHGVRRQTAGIRYFLRPQIHRFTTMTVGHRVADDPRIKEICLLHSPGAEVPDPGSSSGRLGYVVATGATYQETTALLDAVDAAVVFS
ncbi:ATP-grasp domain-containing protein [Micromonospora lutea]|uniref:Phosphoribosylglycinamide synthetase n=1 Tax=Micromonospora lutea TaxID=419825 RepID=A0ABQ4J1E4_9ACTN|nr:ATP-grasp domain-containing protein [Micromonospora lutea]GIJ24028.1 phosphoribosylglycinamide synthetase [Micromonospora lutea]